MALTLPTGFAIRVYEGQDEWVSKKYLAHMNLGNNLYMSFFGATAKEAEDKARSWYETESKRLKKQETDEARNNVDPADMTANGWGTSWNGPNTAWDKANTPAASSHHFAGKIWMIKVLDDGSKDRKRVDQSEQSVYEAQGYFKGGPRS